MGIFSKISSFFTGKNPLDVATAESLSDALITADIAPDLAESLVSKLRAKGTVGAAEAKQILFDAMLPIAEKLSSQSPVPSPAKPKVLLIIGVNGAGKTTTIGKLAKQWTDAGKKVIVGACDTFRAAGGEQLDVWVERAGAVLIPTRGVSCPPPGEGAGCAGAAAAGTTRCDPASVAYQAVERGVKDGADIVILDTAGRLHNRSDLMDELSKITRVIKKIMPDAPHETVLVLDGMTGQNATAQIEHFDKSAKLTGLIITKMDSTSKGGFLISYAANAGRNNAPLPIVAIGYGEKITDLRPFDASEYLKKLLDIEHRA